MVTGSEREDRLTHWRVRGADHLRSVKNGSENRGTKLFPTRLGLARALVLLLMLQLLGQGLLLGVAGATLILMLQELVDPTPLFWSAPWEAWRLVSSRRHLGNHIWLHRTLYLARESIGRSVKSDGFAMADGFVVLGVGSSQQLIRWTAECAWRGIAHERERVTRNSCKAVRFLVAVWFMTGGLLAVSLWRGIDLPVALLIALVSAAAGHGLARPAEKMLANWLAVRDWPRQEAQGFRLEVEPIKFPELLWWQGGQGFIVRHVPDEEPRAE